METTETPSVMTEPQFLRIYRVSMYNLSSRPSAHYKWIHSTLTHSGDNNESIDIEITTTPLPSVTAEDLGLPLNTTVDDFPNENNLNVDQPDEIGISASEVAAKTFTNARDILGYIRTKEEHAAMIKQKASRGAGIRPLPL